MRYVLSKWPQVLVGILYGFFGVYLSAHAHAGEDLGEWRVTRYYTPMPGQEMYYNDWKDPEAGCHWRTNIKYLGYKGGKGNYAADMCMNGGGKQFVGSKPVTHAACPPGYEGETLHVEKIGYLKCLDRGAAIVGKRLDVWVGSGDEGYENLMKIPAGVLKVHKKVE